MNDDVQSDVYTPINEIKDDGGKATWNFVGVITSIRASSETAGTGLQICVHISSIVH